MLLDKDPCKGCIINVMCEQMCPKVIKYYSGRIRRRTKKEVEQATGYYWEDDYVDPKTGKIFNSGGACGKISSLKERNKKSIIEKFIKFINKGK